MEPVSDTKILSRMMTEKVNMPLKPLLNMKVDELFLKWISLPEQSYLFEKLQRVPYQLPIEKPKNATVEKMNGGSPLNETVNDGNKPLLSPRRIIKDKSHGMVIDPKRPVHDDATRVPLTKQRSSHPPAAAVGAKRSSKANVPKFYFPKGDPNKANKPEEGFENTISIALPGKQLNLAQMPPICKACGCPLYWKCLLFGKAAEGNSTVSKDRIVSLWKNITSEFYDDASRFMALVAKDDNNFIEFLDLLPLMRDVVDTHPGLSFLKEAPEFHTRYMNTVIARIFYTVNRSWSGRITVNELRRSNFLSVLQNLENEQDINSVIDYFSYEHFYVIYCKFWELDTDHDLFIDSNDLTRHGDGVLSSRLVSRILSGAVQRWRDPSHQSGMMSYIDFIWFLISEEDKTTKTSIEYWFRCMDLDGDGYISLYEMEYFYEEQIRKLELLDIEPLPFTDCACSMLDMIRPSKPDCVSLSDLKRCGLAGIFFDTFLNVEKYLEHEQKDPFANSLLDDEEEAETRKQTNWEKYAAEEYEVLVAEEQANEADSMANVLDDDGRGQLSILHCDKFASDW